MASRLDPTQCANRAQSRRRLDSRQIHATILGDPITRLLGEMDEEIAEEPWCAFGEFDSRLAAEVIRSLLEAENVDCGIDSASLELGIPAKFVLSVPRSKLHRARWIVEQRLDRADGHAVGPQSKLYLPEGWLHDDGPNVLLVFDEHGFDPGGTSLEY